ncbi:MAG: hypothetical protein GY719_00265 [bacterium]|nr:hypothetical protein [bacterium]
MGARSLTNQGLVAGSPLLSARDDPGHPGLHLALEWRREQGSNLRAAERRPSSRSTATTWPWRRFKALADDGAVPAKAVSEAIERYGVDPEKPDPSRS